MQVGKPDRADFEAWSALYAGYADFYQVAQTDGMRARVWGWIHDPAHEMEALVAVEGGRMLGLAHFRAFARPLTASTGGFLDDLFVSPEARGSGAAQALIDGVAQEGRNHGWSVIRWITAENNYRARALYDRIALRTPWITYDLRP
jgi:ribosomal protein S18 acetylase RimI-like enzyme